MTSGFLLEVSPLKRKAGSRVVDPDGERIFFEPADDGPVRDRHTFARQLFLDQHFEKGHLFGRKLRDVHFP